MLLNKPLDDLLTEQVNPASEGIDALATARILEIINAEDRKVADAVACVIPAIARAVDAIVAAIQAGGRLFYIGAGTSGRLGVLDAAECPPTFSAPPELVQGIMAGGEAALARATETSEDDPSLGARDLRERGFSACDVLVGIAASGRTPYVLGAVEEARRLGAVTVGISCTPDSELARAVAIAITPLTGPEIIHRLHAHEGGHGHQVSAEHDQHVGIYPARICVWQFDGERTAEEQQAGRSGTAHRGSRNGSEL